jgi:general secretion pathway protein N
MATVMPSQCRLRASRRQLLIIAAVVIHGSTIGTPVASADAASITPARQAAIEIGTAVVSGNPIAEVPLGRLSATRDRPLFSPSRRPPAPPHHQAKVHRRVVEPPAPQPPPAPPGIALFGIVVGAQGPRAFIATGPADDVIGVRPGDDVAGWKVTAITQRSLVLSHDDQSATFNLFSTANASQTKQSDAAAPSHPVIRTAAPPHRRVRIR